MKNIDFGQIVHVVANIGVLGGLILLVLELNQNNQLIRSAGVVSLNEKAIEWNARIAESAEIAEIVAKAVNNEILTEVEQIRLEALNIVLLSSWLMDYQQYQTGLITQEYMNSMIPRYKNSFRVRPYESVYWEQIKIVLPQEFVRFIDECVICDC